MEHRHAGCAACLQQHKKCDEARPACQRCSRLSIPCDYSRNLRWCNGARFHRSRRRGDRKPQRPSISRNEVVLANSLRSDDGDSCQSVGLGSCLGLFETSLGGTPQDRTPATESGVDLVKSDSSRSGSYSLEFNDGDMIVDDLSLSEFTSSTTTTSSDVDQRRLVNYEVDYTTYRNQAEGSLYQSSQAPFRSNPRGAFDGNFFSVLFPGRSEQTAYFYCNPNRSAFVLGFPADVNDQLCNAWPRYYQATPTSEMATDNLPPSHYNHQCYSTPSSR